MRILFIFSIASLLHLYGCGADLNNRLPRDRDVDHLNGRLDDVEKDIAVVTEKEKSNAEGAMLTRESINANNTYLGLLYENINSTRPQDLPEWQEMYHTLTDENSMRDPEYRLGVQNLQTNFFRLHLSIDENRYSITANEERLHEQENIDSNHTNKLSVIMERLTTIDNNISQLNRVVDEKHRSVNEVLSNYEGRIATVENRMRTVEIDLDSFRSDFVEYKQRVANIENLLRRYELAVMYGDIRNLKKTATNHEERLIDLLGQVQNNSRDISTNRTNLNDTDTELSLATSGIGQLKVSLEELAERLDSCACFRVGL